MAARDLDVEGWASYGGSGGDGGCLSLPAAPPAAAGVEARSWDRAPPAGPQGRRAADKDREGADFADELLSLADFLQKFAHALTRSRDEAEELVQDALLQAWRHRNSFQPGSNLRGWAGTILRNQFFARRRRVRIVAHPGTELELERLEAPETASTALEVAELDRALGALPPDQREAVLLVALGYSYEEAAEAMSCPVGTAKSRVFRGRAMLQAQLEGAQAQARKPGPSPDLAGPAGRLGAGTSAPQGRRSAPMTHAGEEASKRPTPAS